MTAGPKIKVSCWLFFSIVIHEVSGSDRHFSPEISIFPLLGSNFYGLDMI